MPRTYDAIVIGTGQSGPALARRMAREGYRVAVVERKRVGGTCVNTGCIPTKALVASARVAALTRRAAEYGVALEAPPRMDMARVKARMREIAGKSRDAVTRGLEKNERITLVRGHARLAGPRTVVVGDDELVSERIFLNVGARATEPELPGLDEVPWYQNSSFLELDELPEHLIVVGGSYVGLELGQMYRRFGSEVTILQRGRQLVPREDPDVAEALRRILEDEGITVRLNAECISFEKRGAGLSAGVECDEGSKEVAGSHALIAVGRTPNTHDLGAEAAGLRLDERGWIEVDDALRTSVPGIWALGDCNGRGAFTHTSYNDYEIVADWLFGERRRKVSDRIEAYGLYTDPPLGRCGLTERDARRSGRDVLIARFPMEYVGRATERSETAGFMKVLVDAESERFLGAALLGIEGDEVMHTILDLMYADAPYTVVTRAMHVHPTVSEYLPSLLEGLEPLERA